jgi:hypothetical protein
MATQLDWLASLSHLPNVQLGIIPVSATPLRGPMNTFTVYDERLVTAETFSGSLVMRDPQDVELHLELFARFADVALFADAARELLTGWATAFRRSGSPNLCHYGNRTSPAGLMSLMSSPWLDHRAGVRTVEAIWQRSSAGPGALPMTST